jgi:2-succinyl-6-hydroxy-2,4-cyclohexadiene-1-carboxylate synthase
VTAPLLLLHGFTGSPASWDDVLRTLPERSVLRPALFGHAGAEPASSSFDAEVTRLSACLPGEPAHLAGYSLGARLALALALRHPSAVSHLTLIGVHPGLTSEAERAERRRSDAELAERLESGQIASFVDFWESQALFASQVRVDAARRARKRAERLAHDPRGLAAALRATGLGAMPDLGEAIATFPKPLTLVAGELDTKFVGLARGIAACQPRAELVVVPNAGHDLLLEAPEAVAKLLIRH